MMSQKFLPLLLLLLISPFVEENGNFISTVFNNMENEFKSSNGSFIIETVETYNKENAVKDVGNKEFDVSLSSKDIIDQVGFGWNLGNTFDSYDDDYLPNQGLSSETYWGNPKTTYEMIKTLAKKGIKTLRIPVTWHNHLIDDKYTIDPEWIRRVKAVVDWAIDNDLYVILNTHHDNADYNKDGIKYGYGYYPFWNDAIESENFLYNIWRQIAIAFNNGYDHHLIFEGLNEPRLKGLENEWWYDEDDSNCKEAAAVLNEYNRLILKAIRDSEGNNLYRFVLIAPYCVDISSVMSSDFVIPEDKINPSIQLPTNYKKTNRVLISIHSYSPYNLVMNPDMKITKFTEEFKDDLYERFKNLYVTLIKKGYNVIIGETGIINKNNTEDRINWGKYYISTCRKYQIATMIWDNGNWDNSVSAETTYALFDRVNLKWYNDNIIDAFIKSGNTPLEDNSDIFETDLRETFDTINMVIDKKDKSFSSDFSSRDLVDQMQF